VQTFLPYPDFRRSAQVLDRARLGKQRLEAYQLLRILRGEAQGKGWANHPALRMWKGYPEALAEYGMAVCVEWKARGYTDNMMPHFVRMRGGTKRARLPPWFGDDRLHASHRANLLRKDPLFYGRFGWEEDPAMPYFWPVPSEPKPAPAPLAGRQPGAERPARKPGARATRPRKAAPETPQGLGDEAAPPVGAP
jgi:hypothetical protein